MINMHEVDGTSPHWNLTFLYNYLKASDCKFSSMSLSSRTSYSGKEWFYPAHPHPVLDVFDNSQIDHQTISCLFQSSQMLSTWSNREGISEVLATSMIWRREMTGSHLTVMWFPGNRWRIYLLLNHRNESVCVRKLSRTWFLRFGQSCSGHSHGLWFVAFSGPKKGLEQGNASLKWGFGIVSCLWNDR